MSDRETSPNIGPRAGLQGVALGVRDPERLAAFYIELLGMCRLDDGDGIRLGYEGQGSCLVLRQSRADGKYEHGPNDRYWKIGITLPNVDLAFRQLRQRGVEVTEPRQFEDIGYLCHLRDPEGFVIELLQHSFAGQPRTGEGDAGQLLGGGALIGQITLRTHDIAGDLDHFRGSLRMQLLSIQPVPRHGFDLYFLAFTHDEPPLADLRAIANRPWLWQRPYTLLELQHIPGRMITQPGTEERGFQELLLNR